MTSSKKSKIILICITVLIFASVLWWLQDWVMAHNNNRYYYFCLPLATAVAAAIDARSKFRKLSKLPDNERTKFASKLKLHSELWAASALITFAAPYFQIGLEMDRNARIPRIKIFNEARSILVSELTPNLCSRTEQLTQSCSIIHGELKKIITSITINDEKSINVSVNLAIFELENITNVMKLHQEQDIRKAIQFLRALDLSEELMSRLLKSLTLLTLIFATFAVSRKVALAWDEYDRIKRKSKPTINNNNSTSLIKEVEECKTH